jgi:hypothetical protein
MALVDDEGSAKVCQRDRRIGEDEKAGGVKRAETFCG